MLEIRQARFEDYSDIAKLHADSWYKHYRGILSDTYLDADNFSEKPDLWRKRLYEPQSNQLSFVAFNKMKLVGFCCVYIDDDPIFGSLIDNLHIASEIQRTGLGRRLLSMVDRHLTEAATTKRIYLWVFELNYDARKAYEKLGGRVHEIIEQKSYDGNLKRICRITWNDSSVFS